MVLARQSCQKRGNCKKGSGRKDKKTEESKNIEAAEPLSECKRRRRKNHSKKKYRTRKKAGGKKGCYEGEVGTIH